MTDAAEARDAPASMPVGETSITTGTIRYDAPDGLIITGHVDVSGSLTFCGEVAPGLSINRHHERRRCQRAAHLEAGRFVLIPGFRRMLH